MAGTSFKDVSGVMVISPRTGIRRQGGLEDGSGEQTDRQTDRLLLFARHRLGRELDVADPGTDELSTRLILRLDQV
jgi:hypothetical protein